MANTSTRHRGLFTNIDWVMVILWLLLVIIGWLNIYSSGNKDEIQNVFDFSERYGKQLIWIGLAMFIAIMLLLIDARAIPPLSFLIYTGVMVALVAVLFFGKEVNNSKSWFQIGGFLLQPSEFAKLATALALARIMSTLNFDLTSRKSLLTIAGIIVFPMLLIILQPDMGSAIVLTSFILVLYRFGLNRYVLFGSIYLIILFMLAMLFSDIILTLVILLVATGLAIYLKGRMKEMIVVFTIAIISIVLVFTVDYFYSRGLKPHQKERIEVYLSNLKGVDRDIKNVGYNFYQSKVAIGSGGFAGKGYLKGTQTKMNFIPEQDTDFIFCTVGEEWGFLGSLTVITLFLLLMSRIIARAELQRSRFSLVYGYAVASIFFFHFIVNIGMTIGLAPVIGIPLPFMSYGGSSLWGFTILLFIFIKQDMHRYEVIG
ncbi:MAG: rod shape-determining protein RodA [Bacteroidales bacterium]